jgi:transposase
MEIFPPSIEDYISQDHPVRAYDAFVEALNLNELGIILDDHKVGNSEYYPKAMLKLVIYGYSYGFRSSRKLERAVHDNFSFIWLTGGLSPDHKTIAEFRRRNKTALKNVLKQCARLCIKLDLIAGNTLFTDGTKIRANASIKNTWTKEKCEKYLQHIDQHIESILSECDAIDNEEQSQPTLIKMKSSLKEKEALKSEIQKILKELKEEDKKSLNTVDPECTRINSLKGSHAGYNAQIVVDEKHGLIVNSDVVSKNNDTEQFADQVNQANEILGKKCKVACSDSGYADTRELEKIDKQGIKVIVPSQRQASKKEPKPFDKERFNYDSQKDEYTCPEGNKLIYKRMIKRGNAKQYSIITPSICRECKSFGICTSSKYHGRRVSRLLNEAIRQRLEAQYLDHESQAIYKLRKQKVELPFGHIKRNLKVDAFLMRGREGAKAEMSLLTSCFNIARIITILGVKGFIQELQEGIFCLYRKMWIKRQKVKKSASFMSKNICLN